MKKLVIFSCFLAAVSIAVAGSIIREGSLRAKSDGNNVVVQWGSVDESAVKSFIVERRGDEVSDFFQIGALSAKGSNSYYEFVDQSAFKSDQLQDSKTGSVYQYRICIVSTSGSISYSQSISVSHNVSGVKRTWGSLKAMFR